MKLVFIGLFLSLMTLSTHAENREATSVSALVEGLHERLPQAAVLRGMFEQNKQVTGFKKPLQSRGDFLVVRDRGVIWRTVSPFPSRLKLTRDEIVAKQDGGIAFRLSADREPAVRIINGLLFALLNGDVSGLTEQFNVNGSFNGASWQLTLVPKSASLGKIMSKIELSGNQFVQLVRIEEANSDQTTIRFSGQHREPEQLSKEEAAQFD